MLGCSADKSDKELLPTNMDPMSLSQIAKILDKKSCRGPYVSSIHHHEVYVPEKS